MAGSPTAADYINDLRDLYVEYVAAEKAILKAGQEYTIGDRTLTRADIRYVQGEKKKLFNEICKMEAGKGLRSQRINVLFDT